MKDLKELQELLEQHLQQYELPSRPQLLYDPIRYTLQMGGKRIRPCLALIGCQLLGKKAEEALDAALTVELFHNFTLLHDDIMDDAPLRRGKPTVHNKYNQNVAILSGDVMLVEAYKALAKLPAAGLPKLLQLFNKTAVEVCEGQQYDMDFERQENVDVAEYVEMIRLKTAVLLACSLEMGARIAGATAAQAEKLYAFGEQLGLAFQLQDDYLDSFGSPETFGKTVGGDIAQNKKTFLLIKALELSSESDQTALQNWLATPSTASAESSVDKINAVKAIYQSSGAEAATLEAMENKYRLAMQLLDELEVEESGKAPLRELASRLMVRQV